MIEVQRSLTTAREAARDRLPAVPGERRRRSSTFVAGMTAGERYPANRRTWGYLYRMGGPISRSGMDTVTREPGGECARTIGILRDDLTADRSASGGCR